VGEQAEEGEKMKKKILAILLLILLAVIGASETVCAGAIGDGYNVGGIGVGWILVAIAIIGGLLIYFDVISKELGKKVGVLLVAFFLIGLALQFVQVETPTASVTPTATCPDFKITGTAVADGTVYYIGHIQDDPQWDEDTNTYTIPLDVDSASNGRLNESITALNFTIDPIATTSMTADTMATCHFKSDYDLQYSGEDVFDKTGSYYDVNWTTSTGTESYEDTVDLQVSETTWALCTWEFNNNSASNWVSELDAIGDSITWYVTFYNDCGWSETITIQAIVVEYTA